MMVWKRYLLSNMDIWGIYVKFRGCTCKMSSDVFSPKHLCLTLNLKSPMRYSRPEKEQNSSKKNSVTAY